MTEDDAKDPFALFETMPELCAFVYQDRGPETLLKGLTFGDSSPHGDREFYEQSALELEAMGLKKVASVVWEAAATRVSKFDRWEPAAYFLPYCSAEKQREGNEKNRAEYLTWLTAEKAKYGVTF